MKMLTITAVVVLFAAVALGYVDPAFASVLPMVMMQTAPGPGGVGSVLAPPVPGATIPATGTSATPDPNAANDYKWLGEGVKPEVLGYVQNKGWKTPLEMADGYMNLEKAMGSHRLALPKDEKDEAGWGKVFDAMGRPKAPADYKLPVPEGHDPKFAGAAAEVMHKVGLLPRQAQALAGWWNEQQVAMAKQQEQDAAQAFEAGMTKLKSEWGGAFTEKVEAAKRAARVFGIDGETFDKYEKTIGAEATTKLFARIGEALGEHKSVGMDTIGSPAAGALTPDQAKAELARLQQDKQWVQDYFNGKAENRARMESLHKWAYPEG